MQKLMSFFFSFCSYMVELIELVKMFLLLGFIAFYYDDLKDFLWEETFHGCFFGPISQVIAASGAVKHEDVVEQVKKLFTKLSADPTTATQLVAKEPAFFTGSEVGEIYLEYFVVSLYE
jgi:hypothetical protein